MTFTTRDEIGVKSYIEFSSESSAHKAGAHAEYYLLKLIFMVVGWIC